MAGSDAARGPSADSRDPAPLPPPVRMRRVGGGGAFELACMWCGAREDVVPTVPAVLQLGAYYVKHDPCRRAGSRLSSPV